MDDKTLAELIKSLSLPEIDWNTVETVGQLDKMFDSRIIPSLPTSTQEQVKLWLPPTIDRAKEPRQLSPSAIPMISFYNAGSMVGSMRLFAKELNKHTGSLAINPIFVELPGHGTRARETPLTHSRTSSAQIAALVAAGPLAGDRKKKFIVYGHSVGTLHAFEITRELEKLGFFPRALLVLNHRAPQLAMNQAEDNFLELSDEQLVYKFVNEYGQKGLLDLWRQSPEVVSRGLPVTRADISVMLKYTTEDVFWKLRTPIICVGSTRDRNSNSEKFQIPWRDLSVGGFYHRMVDGGHFVISENPSDVWREVFPILDNLLSGR
eukprot:TRINITY_DN881_c0_g1_i1.p1 TRINITY_DN881_c0_g1~~TRINITY_DN881_c0_g1_i1.p1  ORF type:complete len:321 (-),score=64.56 TRINITY_DN881_c0_g1_i1:93-1055(-)